MLTLKTNRFQFLYGTIISVFRKEMSFRTVRFQFLYGTIISPASFPLVFYIVYFNSSMVRL